MYDRINIHNNKFRCVNNLTMLCFIVEYLASINHLRIRYIKKGGNVMEKFIMDARTLACYIIDFYKHKFNKEEISPLKLQKSLYFCFAYWGGFVRKMELGKNELNKEYIELLFNNSIEAWVYGPVVPDVYHAKDLSPFHREKPFQDDFIQDFIDGVLMDVLSSSDFKLVEVSHSDKCWKKNFKPTSKFHNCVIPFEEIISEYAKSY